MKLHNLESSQQKTKKRVGRGIASGKGGTSGRGNKGQRSRSGFNLPKKFEGGQTALIMRLPKKKGFRSLHPRTQIVKISSIEANFRNGEKVSPKTLFDKGIIRDPKSEVKIISGGRLTKNVKIIGCNVSAGVEKMIRFVKAGGGAKTNNKTR